MLDSIERRERAATTRLLLRLPERLRVHLDASRLKDSKPTDAIPLDTAEELLLAIDAVLGDGSGRVLEDCGAELTTRSLLRSTAGVVSGDLHATMARQHAALERPFVGVEVRYDLTRNDTGFTLTVGVRGRPRSTKLLRYLTAGAIRSAQRFARETDEDTLRIYGDTLGDRSELTVRLRAPSASPVPERSEPQPPVSRRSPSRTFRAPTLAAEVDRIMTSAGLASVPPPPSGRKSSPGMPAVSMPEASPRGSVTIPATPAGRRPRRDDDGSSSGSRGGR